MHDRPFSLCSKCYIYNVYQLMSRHMTRAISTVITFLLLSFTPPLHCKSNIPFFVSNYFFRPGGKHFRIFYFSVVLCIFPYVFPHGTLGLGHSVGGR